jgi:hypothetical protein
MFLLFQIWKEFYQFCISDFIVLSFSAKIKYERKGAQKEKFMALLPTSLPELGPKAINFAPFWGLPAHR